MTTETFPANATQGHRVHYDRDYFEGRTSYFYQWGGYRDVGSYFNRLAAWFLPHAGTGPVLDVGCAYGFLLSRFVGGERPLHGCDVSDWAIRQARRRFPQGEFLTVDGTGPLPYDDGRFDAVLCTDVLEHLPHDEQPRLLGEVVRVLAPGGRFCMTTPNLGYLRRLVYAPADRAEKHIGLRHIKDWRARLARHGLALVDSWTYLNGFLPGRLRVGWLPECALVARKGNGAAATV